MGHVIKGKWFALFSGHLNWRESVLVPCWRDGLDWTGTVFLFCVGEMDWTGLVRCSCSVVGEMDWTGLVRCSCSVLERWTGLVRCSCSVLERWIGLD